MYFDGPSKIPMGEKQEDDQNNKAGIEIVFVKLDNKTIFFCFKKGVTLRIQQHAK